MTGSSKRGGCLRIGLLTLGGLIALMILLIVVGSVIEGQAQRADYERYPAPGEMVTLGDRQMHLHCQGSGSPTVILDAGQGGWSIDMEPLAEDILETTRVCTYDRAGYGWSDEANDARSPQDIANDLSALLTAAEIEPPYVIVAFSHTGLSSRVFAAQNPDDVVGMVLIDPATEFDNEVLGEEMLAQQRSFASSYGLFEALAGVGLVRFLNPREMAGSAPYFATPENVAQPDVYYTFAAHPKWWRTSAREFNSRLNDLDQVGEMGQIGDIPLIIIGAEFVDGADDSMAAIQQARLEKLEALAAQSPQGEFILAEGASHNVIVEQPALVIDAVKRVIAAASE